MEQSHNLPGRGHSRNKSMTKARPRSTTKGPLDVDDVSLSSPKPVDATAFLSPTPSLHQPSPNPPASVSSAHHDARSPRSPRSPAPRSPGPPRPAPKKDFSFLLRPEIYHPLTPLTVPVPFRNSPNQPAPDTAIPELLAKGHYRVAAVAAMQALTGTGGYPALDPHDHVRIFSLLHTRLACLTVIDATPIAAQEVKALEDVQSPFYLAYPPAPTPAVSQVSSPTSTTAPFTAGHGLGLGLAAAMGSPDPSVAGSGSSTTPAQQPAEPPEHLVPWDLRVLAVRLQALGFGDPRRSVMSYYDLAREARSRLARASASHDNTARELWKERLAELGIRVAGALIEMEDLAGATAHLETLKGGPAQAQGGAAGGRLAIARALLWLHLGDVDAARRCVEALTPGGPTRAVAATTEGAVGEKIVSALCDMADGEYRAALATWRELREELPRDEMVGVNTAVCLLYVGKMEQGRVILEGLVDSGHSSRTLLFNLATMYELCTDRARILKQRLAERVAAMEPSVKGWEKTNADFKL